MANMFDENGNYIKTEWKPGDRITAGKLNKIEESLEAINNNDIERHKEADERLDALEEQNEAVNDRFDELEDLVADNKSEVDTAIYEVHSKMDRLEQEMNDGIDTVEAIAHTVDDKIAAADASMKAQVAEVEADLEGLHDKDEELSEQLAHIVLFLKTNDDKGLEEVLSIAKQGDTISFYNFDEYTFTEEHEIPSYINLKSNGKVIKTTNNINFLGNNLIEGVIFDGCLESLTINIEGDNVLFDRCTFKNWKTKLEDQTTTIKINEGCSDTKIINCTFDTIYPHKEDDNIGNEVGAARSIECLGKNTHIERNIFKNMHTREDSDYIMIRSVFIDDTSFPYCEQTIVPNKKGDISNAKIINNIFYQNCKSSIKTFGSDIVIENNVFYQDYNFDSPVYNSCVRSYYSENINIKNNVVNVSGYNTCRVLTGEYIKNSSMENNVININNVNNSVAGESSKIISLLACKDITVSQNRINFKEIGSVMSINNCKDIKINSNTFNNSKNNAFFWVSNSENVIINNNDLLDTLFNMQCENIDGLWFRKNILTSKNSVTFHITSDYNNNINISDNEIYGDFDYFYRVATSVQNNKILKNIFYDVTDISKIIYANTTTQRNNIVFSSNNLNVGLDNGEFTPTFNVDATYTRQQGQYSVCGDLLFFTIQLTGTFGSSLTGNLSVNGLPFKNTNYIVGNVTTAYKTDFADNIDLLGGVVDRGGNSILLQKQTSNCTTAYINTSDLSNTKFNIVLSGFYKINY